MYIQKTYVSQVDIHHFHIGAISWRELNMNSLRFIHSILDWAQNKIKQKGEMRKRAKSA